MTGNSTAFVTRRDAKDLFSCYRLSWATLPRGEGERSSGKDLKYEEAEKLYRDLHEKGITPAVEAYTSYIWWKLVTEVSKPGDHSALIPISLFGSDCYAVPIENEDRHP